MLGCVSKKMYILRSRLAWGVWVEISVNDKVNSVNDVTPRMRRVSRNLLLHYTRLRVTRHASHEACE